MHKLASPSRLARQRPHIMPVMRRHAQGPDIFGHLATIPARYGCRDAGLIARIPARGITTMAPTTIIMITIGTITTMAATMAGTSTMMMTVGDASFQASQDALGAS